MSRELRQNQEKQRGRICFCRVKYCEDLKKIRIDKAGTTGKLAYGAILIKYFYIHLIAGFKIVHYNLFAIGGDIAVNGAAIFVVKQLFNFFNGLCKVYLVIAPGFKLFRFRLGKHIKPYEKQNECKR